MDHLQDIARSSYADMLNDDERNHAYYTAIRATISHLVKSSEINPARNRFYRCCDIGAGSGLLSMMIVRAFRSLEYEHFHVTAFEAFEPMAECAQKVIISNDMSDKITLTSSRSEKCKPDSKFDLLVAELLDTELIGEGCLLTYRHAVENLCSPDCIYIPQEANIYIQPLESSYLISRQIVQDMQLLLVNCNKPNQKQTITVRVSDDVKTCCGLAEIDDMQLSQIEKSSFRELAEPRVVFKFKFSDLRSLRLRDTQKVDFKLYQTKDFEDSKIVIAMWWDVKMYDESLFNKYLVDDSYLAGHSFSIVSCAPDWSRSKLLRKRDDYIVRTYGRGVWREHWIQGVYYLQSQPVLTGNEQLTLYAHHDSHSLWFDSKPCQSKLPDTCTCGVHRLLSRSDIGFLNNSELISRLTSALLYRRSVKTFPTRGKIVFNRRKVSRSSGSDELCEDNDHRWHVSFWNENNQQLPEKLFDYKLQDDVSWSRLIGRHSNGEPIAPFIGFDIKCMQVCFSDLNRIRTNVLACQGFDLSYLDELINLSSSLVDSNIESHHLHEYECQCVVGAKEQTVIFSSENLTVDERHRIIASELNKNIQLSRPLLSDQLRRGWALVFWADFKLINGDIISSGPCVDNDGRLRFNPHFRQLVHFLHEHPLVESQSSWPNGETLNLEIKISLDGIKLKQQ